METSALHLARAVGSAALALLCACASVSGPAEKPMSARQERPRVRSTPVDVRPGYRARITVGIYRSGAQDNWSDIAILAQTEVGRQICEALVESQMRVLTNTGLHATTARACSTAPLATMPMVAGEFLLVAERAISDVEVLLLLPQASDGLRKAGTATVTDFTRFQTKEECQRALAKMENARHNDQASAEATARSWLQGQVQEQEQSAKRACEEKTEVDARCAKIGGGKAEVEKACQASTRSKRCEEARQRAMERNLCEVEQVRAGRSCENARAVLQLVRQRLAAPQPSQDPAALRPECRKL